MRSLARACLVVSILSATIAAAALAQGLAPQVFAPGVISGPANDLSPAFTPDGKTVFFTRSNSSQSTILVSHLIRGTWSTPQIATFSGMWRDLEATMAPDGSYLVFVSNRPASGQSKPLDGFYNGAAQPRTGGNLWRVDRTAGGWGEPHRLPDVVNSNTSIYSPSIAGDGSIYFMQPTGAKARFHLFRAQLSHGAFAAPIELSLGLGPDVGAYDPAVAPDESFMVFSSSGGADKGTSLFITFQKHGVWTTPEYMGDVVSRPNGGNIEARLGPDHRTLYFSSVHVEPTSWPSGVAESKKGLQQMTEWNNSLENICYTSLEPWLSRQAK